MQFFKRNSIALLFIALSFIPKNSSSQFLHNFDLNTEINLSEHRTPGTTKFMQDVSNTSSYHQRGHSFSFDVSKGLLTHDKQTQKESLYMFESFGISSVITLLPNILFNRERPFQADSLIIKASDGGSPSFPSGHASEAFSIATSLSILYPKWYVIAPSMAWASLAKFFTFVSGSALSHRCYCRRHRWQRQCFSLL